MQGRRDVVDWALFVALSFLWASAFSFTKLAVADLPPRLVIVLRLHLGAAILLGALYVSGGALPSLRDRRRWASMVSMGLVGMTVPFLLVTIGQQTVPSSLASLYVAAAPLITICGVHLFFHDEKLTLRAAMGVAIGFIGVGILLGPSIFNTTDSGGVWAQILCLLGATGYAASNLIAKGAPDTPRLAYAAGFVTAAAVGSWVFLFELDLKDVRPDLGSVIGVVGLGVAPSALAPLAYFALVKRAGATFLSLTNYAVPALASIIGLVLFKEKLGWNAFAAFGLILFGVWLAQSQRPTKLSR